MGESLATTIAATSAWEGVAVVLAVAYLLLAARAHVACWACALTSSAIYTALFWQVSLPMQSLLNLFYVGMAIYGWRQWRAGGPHGVPLAITSWPWPRHVLVLTAVGVLTLANGYLLERGAVSAWPYLDALMTWGAVLATFMIARKVLENWIYWFVLDAIAIPLYLERGLLLSAVLFAGYLVIVIDGYRRWRRVYHDGLVAAV